MKTIARLAAALLLTLASLSNTQAQLSDEELAKIAQNPLANLISLPFQNNTNFGVGPFDRTQNVTNFQPVLPFANGKIITRVVVPFVSQPNILSETGSSTGLSDITFSAFYAHGGEGKVSWGVGPIINIPTAAEGLGAGEWGVGPSFVAVIKPGNWVIGALVNNVWSVGNDKINSFLLQPFINCNLPKGNYLTFSPGITANWNADSDDRWTVPLGMGAGKIIRVGRSGLPLNVQAGAYYNVVKPEFTGADWTLRLGATILLPKAIFKKK